MNQKFTQKSERVLSRCPEIAESLGHTYIGSEHLLLALAEEEDSVAARFLEGHAADSAKLRRALAELAGVGSPSRISAADMTPRTRHIIEASAALAKESAAMRIGTEHLLCALLGEQDAVAVKLLESLGVNSTELRHELTAFLEETARLASKKRTKTAPSPITGLAYLGQYGRDLGERYREGRTDPLIGREEEIARTLRILTRRQKNNPCLIGEPGVGKTAIAEGIAARIAEGRVPKELLGKAIVQLDVTSMVAGAKYRGEFEDRMRGVLEELRRRPDVILFIDELHTIVGAGAAEGAIDAASILKPALARGELRLIGATTVREYRLQIERDAALRRRFEEVFVKEPSAEEAVRILLGLAERYEEHHGLSISLDAIRAAVRLSVRYLPDGFLPDKAIDLLDEAAAELHLASAEPPKELTQVEEALAALAEEKLNAIRAQSFEEAAALRDRERALTEERTALLRAAEARHTEERPLLGAEHIAAAVMRRTSIPVTALTEDEGERLAGLEEALGRRIIGQDEAISALCRAVKRKRIGLSHPERPVGCFLFIGPTGVGKTALSRALAEHLFGEDDAIIRLDMSEYMERHSTSRLIGSPPGYVGYEEGGLLTERIRRRPYAVVLFDEIEKAHPDVLNLLLQIMEDGKLTDSHGREADFSNAIIILTSNVGAREERDARPLGFTASKSEAAEDAAKEAVRHAFRPEFLGRLDEIVRFSPLGDEELRRIAEILLDELAARASESGLTLRFSPELAPYLVELVKEKEFGARPLRRAVTREVEDAISVALLSGRVGRGDEIIVSLFEGGIKVTSATEAAAQ